MSDQLATDIRGMVDDGAPPITLAELEVALLAVPSPRSRRRWLVAAVAVVVAALVVAGTVFVAGAGRGDRNVRTKVPAAPNPTPTTALWPPVTTPGDDSASGALLPEGVSSTPPTGDLVAAATLFHRGAYRLYADGRLLSYVGGPSGGWFDDQRLTPEGVERVRSEFLKSALFAQPDDAASMSSPGDSCTRGFAVCVSDGDRLLVQDPNLEPESVRLSDYMKTLNSTLPPTEWADQQSKR